MLKKTALILFLAFFCYAFLAAYNPQFLGEDMYQFVSPDALSISGSVTGGPVQSVEIEDIGVNPALIAGEQRPAITLSGSLLFQSKVSEAPYAQQKGGAAQLGMLYPTRVGVAALDLQWIDLPEGRINYGNSFTIRGAFAKDLIDDVYLGLGLYGTFGDGWAFAGDLGLWCNIHTVKWLPFMKDCRWGFSLTGMGRGYRPKNVTGVIKAGDSLSGTPSPFTPHFGLAGSFVDVKNFKGGFSFDLSAPTWQNVIFNPALQFVFFNMINLNCGWDFNLREFIATKVVCAPAVSLSFRFNFTASKNTDSFIAKQGWSQSEMDVAGGYRYVTDGIHAVAAGVTIYTGQKDTEPPVINLWEE